MSATFEAVETAIKTALKAALPYCPSVETYAGQFEDIVNGAPVRFPFCGVFFSGQEDDVTPGRGLVGTTIEFSVAIATHGFRGQADLRTGDVGAYRMIHDARNALCWKHLGLDIEGLAPAGVELLISSRTAVGYRLKFKTSFDETFAAD